MQTEQSQDTKKSYPEVVDGTHSSAADRDEASKAAANDDKKETRLEQLSKQNLKQLQTKVATAVRKIREFESDRSEVSADMQSERQQMEAMGISKKALAMAIAVSKMSEDEMDGFDLAYDICRKAIKRPYNPTQEELPV